MSTVVIQSPSIPLRKGRYWNAPSALEHFPKKHALAKAGVAAGFPSENATTQAVQDHFGGSKPLARQRCAMAGEASAEMKARAAAGSVLLAGIAAA